MSNSLNYIRERFEELQTSGKDAVLDKIRQLAFADFNQWGIPTTRHEEWKYTRISGLFNKEYRLPVQAADNKVTAADIEPVQMPGHEDANVIYFINGLYSPALSRFISSQLVVLPLEVAAADCGRNRRGGRVFLGRRRRAGVVDVVEPDVAHSGSSDRHRHDVRLGSLPAGRRHACVDGPLQLGDRLETDRRRPGGGFRRRQPLGYPAFATSACRPFPVAFRPGTPALLESAGLGRGMVEFE